MFSFKKKPNKELLLPDGIAANVGRAIMNDVREQGGDDKVMEKFMGNFPLRRKIAQEIVDNLGDSKRSAITLVPNNIYEYIDNKGNRSTFEIVKTVPQSVFDLSNFEIISFDKWYDFGNFVTIDDLRKRAVKLKANLGLADALCFLDQKNNIPSRYKTNIFLFPGTSVYDVNGELHMPFVSWDRNNACWVLAFRKEDLKVISDRHFLIRCKS